MDPLITILMGIALFFSGLSIGINLHTLLHSPKGEDPSCRSNPTRK